jgi:hypothetical protein
VEAGLDHPPQPPFRQAIGGWILGSGEFVARLRKLAGANPSKAPIAEARQLASLDPQRILAAVADFYDIEPALLAKRHDPHMARAVAAWLCRRHTEATLSELADWLGLSRADSVPNLTRRLQTRLASKPELRNDFSEILKRATSGEPDHRPKTPANPQAEHHHEGRETKNKG